MGLDPDADPQPGCSGRRQRQELVAQAVEQYLDPFLRGRDVQQTTDIWRAATQSSYWRSGPVLNNATSGVDQALWDIKGKRMFLKRCSVDGADASTGGAKGRGAALVPRTREPVGTAEDLCSNFGRPQCKQSPKRAAVTSIL